MPLTITDIKNAWKRQRCYFPLREGVGEFRSSFNAPLRPFSHRFSGPGRGQLAMLLWMPGTGRKENGCVPPIECQPHVV